MTKETPSTCNCTKELPVREPTPSGQRYSNPLSSVRVQSGPTTIPQTVPIAAESPPKSISRYAILRRGQPTLARIPRLFLSDCTQRRNKSTSSSRLDTTTNILNAPKSPAKGVVPEAASMAIDRTASILHPKACGSIRDASVCRNNSSDVSEDDARALSGTCQAVE